MKQKTYAELLGIKKSKPRKDNVLSHTLCDIVRKNRLVSIDVSSWKNSRYDRGCVLAYQIYMSDKGKIKMRYYYRRKDGTGKWNECKCKEED